MGAFASTGIQVGSETDSLAKLAGEVVLLIMVGISEAESLTVALTALPASVNSTKAVLQSEKVLVTSHVR